MSELKPCPYCSHRMERLENINYWCSECGTIQEQVPGSEVVIIQKPYRVKRAETPEAARIADIERGAE